MVTNLSFDVLTCLVKRNELLFRAWHLQVMTGCIVKLRGLDSIELNDCGSGRLVPGKSFGLKQQEMIEVGRRLYSSSSDD